MLNRIRSGFERLLEGVVIFLMVALAVEVTAGVLFRALGMALPWYDEVAAVMLAWLTYYGAVLAAVRRAHIGFPGLVRSLRPGLRLPMVVLAEACVIGFFVLLSWMGYRVLDVLATDHLVSLPSVPVSVTQSVIPISSALFVIAELLNLPDLLAEARGRAPAGPTDAGSAAAAEVSH